MIKNVVVNLWPGKDADAALDYAVSLAAAFKAHLAGVAFAYEAVPAAMLVDDVPRSGSISSSRTPKRRPVLRPTSSMPRRRAPTSRPRRAGGM